LHLDPQPKYYHERAKCGILLDQNMNALKDLNEVIKMQSTNAFAYFRRGFAHKALKLYDEAAEDFMKARELSPDDPRLIINKKQIYQTKYRKLCEAG
jgi:tetratricopeptide (TPR) repeat protein